MHMIGNISHLLEIWNFNGGCVTFAGEKEKKERSQMGTVINGVLKKGNFVLELIRFVLYNLYIIFAFS